MIGRDAPSALIREKMGNLWERVMMNLIGAIRRYVTGRRRILSVVFLGDYGQVWMGKIGDQRRREMMKKAVDSGEHRLFWETDRMNDGRDDKGDEGGGDERGNTLDWSRATHFS